MLEDLLLCFGELLQHPVAHRCVRIAGRLPLLDARYYTLRLLVRQPKRRPILKFLSPQFRFPCDIPFSVRIKRGFFRRTYLEYLLACLDRRGTHRGTLHLRFVRGKNPVP